MRQPAAQRWSIEILLATVAVLFVLPVLLIFVTAFKPDGEIVRFESLWPKQGTLENFRYVFGTPEEVPIVRWLTNSVLISSCVTALVLAVDSLAAYAFARLNPPGGRWVFFVVIATLMVPGQILLVPTYLILSSLGWIDTPWALIVPPGAGAFGVFMLTQFFKAVPRELEEAAAIDGCSRLGIWWHVMLPLSRPALAVLGIFTFIGSWNDFVGPLVFLESADKYTLPVGIAMFQSSYASEYGLTFAACVICTLPVIVLFLTFSRQIIRGMTAGAVKD
jgi:multiple sugar transport system permease protein